MKSEVRKETRPMSASSMRWFAAGLLVMAAAWGVSLIGTHLIWSHDGSGVAQAMLSLGLLTVFPLISAGYFAACAWRAIGVRRRLLASISLAFVIGGMLLTGYLFANANRRAAVWNCLAVDRVEATDGSHDAK